MLNWYPWKVCSFLKNNGGVDLRGRKSGRHGGRTKSGQDIMYERIKREGCNIISGLCYFKTIYISISICLSIYIITYISSLYTYLSSISISIYINLSVSLSIYVICVFYFSHLNPIHLPIPLNPPFVLEASPLNKTKFKRKE